MSWKASVGSEEQAIDPDRAIEAQLDETIPILAERLDALYAQFTRSPTYRRVYRQVYEDAYPEEAEPFGAATRSDLQRIAEVIGVGPGQVLLDLGCGAGGPGLLVAQRTGARLVGMDLSAVAIRQATVRAASWGLPAQATFQVGDISASGLPSAAFDGAMSVDVLWMVPDKRAALREIARVLRPAARFVCTTWEFAESPPDEPQVADYRPLLREAGFVVERYEEDRAFPSYFRALSAAFHAARDDLATDVGAALADDFVDGFTERAALLPGWRRIFITARRTARRGAC
jgi:SAM-dependent methyltransferase